MNAVSKDNELPMDNVDEIVLFGVDVHLEMMDDGLLWGAFYRDGVRVVVWIKDKKGRLSVFADEDDGAWRFLPDERITL